MTKTVLHFDLDTFYVSVERLIDTRLQNRPLLVGGISIMPEERDPSHSHRLTQREFKGLPLLP